MYTNILPTSNGLLRCLHAIADEAAGLGLTRTHLALQQTIRECSAEAGVTVLASMVPLAAEMPH